MNISIEEQMARDKKEQRTKTSDFVENYFSPDAVKLRFYQCISLIEEFRRTADKKGHLELDELQSSFEDSFTRQIRFHIFGR